MQRRKGVEYERLIAREYRKLGMIPHDQVSRGRQSHRGDEASDVVIPGLSIECKHHKDGFTKVYGAMQQAVKSMRNEDDLPVVHIRQNGLANLVVLRNTDWMAMAAEVVDLRLGRFSV